METIRDEVGNRDRIAADLRVLAQTVRDDLPVEIGADRQADGDPGLRIAGEENRAGKTHQQPAGHVRGLCGQRDDPLVHLAPAQIIVVQRLLLAREEESDTQHQREITRKRTQDNPIKHPLLPFSPFPRPCQTEDTATRGGSVLSIHAGSELERDVHATPYLLVVVVGTAGHVAAQHINSRLNVETAVSTLFGSLGGSLVSGRNRNRSRFIGEHSERSCRNGCDQQFLHLNNSSCVVEKTADSLQ